MREYTIFTDSGCDISPSLLKEWGVKYLNLTFCFNGSGKEYTNEDMSVKEFYERMRKGESAKTSAVNSETFKTAFIEELEKGNDILYLGFSSGLSTTYNSARLAAEELSEQYPENEIIAVDTLSASAGQGLLLYLVLQQKKQGASIGEAARFVLDNRLNMCHWFTVDDLEYLKRGGRVSPAVAFVGGVLGIKPVLHVDNEGHLVNVSKARGRKAALKAIVEKYGELAQDASNGTIFMCHADCIEDVEQVKEMIKDKYGAKVELVADIGPVIGAHAGPGTIALFYIGKER